MPLRKILLRVLLWSLGAAALFGAGGILLAEFEAIWRIAGTAFWTAVCAGLMVLFSLLSDRARTREAGLAGLALVVVEYVLVMLVIWDLGDTTRLFGVNWEELFLLESLFLVPCGLAAVVFLALLRVPIATMACWAGMALCALTFAMLSLGAMRDAFGSGGFGLWEHDYYELAGMLAALSPLAIFSLVGAGTGDRRYWRWLGVAAAAAAYAGAAWSIITGARGEEEIFVSIVTVACVVAHANASFCVPVPPGARWLAWATVVAGVATGGAVITSMMMSRAGTYDTDPAKQLIVRLASASAVLAGCGTLALLVLSRLTRRSEGPREFSTREIREISLTCPLCGRRQKLPRGGGRCAGCGLVIRISLQEPRCESCDYSLIMFTGDRCPECGAAVSQALAVDEEDAKSAAAP